MKVAVVITGLPRNVQEGYDHFWKHIIHRYNADVYTYYWMTDDWEKIKDLYDPTRGSYTYPRSFKSYQEGIEVEDGTSQYDERFEVGGYFRGLPMFSTWQGGAYNLRHEIHYHETKYDMVVRGRFDLFNPSINLDNIDPSRLNVSAYNWPNSPICDDNLMVTSQENFLKLHSNIFNDLINYANEHKRIYFQEKNLTNMIEYKGMTHLVHKSSDLKFQFVRDALKHQA